MGKIHWFIIGNILGFGLLIGGIATTESLKQNNEHFIHPLSTNSMARDGQSFVHSKNADTEAKIVTARDISKGTVISAEDIQIREIEKGKTPSGQFKNMADVIGKKAKLDLVEGEILLQNDLVEN
jgi:flagella basal body P-ring formation protein FlgA